MTLPVKSIKRFFGICSMWCCAAICLGQTAKTDSIKRLITGSPNNQARLKQILALCDFFESLPKDTLWNYALKAKQLASETKDPRSMSFAIIAQANAYLRWDNTDSAKALVATELPKYSLANETNRDIYFRLLQLQIDCTGDNNNYKDAIDEVYDLIGKAEKYKDSTVIAESMNTLCAFNYDMNFVDKSREWGYKGLSFTTNAPKFYRVRAGLYHNLADNYWWIGKLDSATYFIGKDIDLGKRLQNLLYLARAYEISANIYSKQKNYPQAEHAILTSTNYIKQVDGNIPQPEELIGLATVYRTFGQIDKAIKVLKDGLVADSVFQYVSPHAKKGVDNRDLQRVFYYQALAKCYSLKGDSKNYEACLEKVIEGKDAFYNTNSAQAIAEFNTKYQVQKKEATIAQQQLSLVRINEMFYFAGLVVVSGGVIGLLLFRDFRTRQKRQSEKAVAEAEETERRRIAADLHDNLGAQLSLIKRNVDFIIDQPQGFSQEDEQKYLNSVNDIAQNAMVDLRETIWVLNKDEVYIEEFADKLKAYVKQQLPGKETIKWSFNENIAQNFKLSSGEVMHLFRIVQEIISNIIKHAEARQIIVDFESKSLDSYRIAISDDGKGFNVGTRNEGHYGLENIERRAKEISAKLLIESAPAGGTSLVLIKGDS
jgi:signal transduction histidine kinase